MSANNFANVLLNLGRTIAMLTRSSFFLPGCDFVLALCLFPAKIYFISMEQMVWKALPDPLMVISSRHIRENVIIPSVVYLMVIKHVPEYSRRESSCILMSLDMKERLKIIRVKY